MFGKLLEGVLVDFYLKTSSLVLMVLALAEGEEEEGDICGGSILPRDAEGRSKDEGVRREVIVT